MEELKKQLAENQAKRIALMSRAVSLPAAKRLPLKLQSQKLQAEADALIKAIRALAGEA